MSWRFRVISAWHRWVHDWEFFWRVMLTVSFVGVGFALAKSEAVRFDIATLSVLVCFLGIQLSSGEDDTPPDNYPRDPIPPPSHQQRNQR
jgi:hypothetical protein